MEKEKKVLFSSKLRCITLTNDHSDVFADFEGKIPIQKRMVVMMTLLTLLPANLPPVSPTLPSLSPESLLRMSNKFRNMYSAGG